MAKREYIQANKDWLEAKAKEEGVKALPNGICYKVLAEGNVQSATPSVRSIVTAHYTLPLEFLVDVLLKVKVVEL